MQSVFSIHPKKRESFVCHVPAHRETIYLLLCSLEFNKALKVLQQISSPGSKNICNIITEKRRLTEVFIEITLFNSYCSLQQEKRGKETCILRINGASETRCREWSLEELGLKLIWNARVARSNYCFADRRPSKGRSWLHDKVRQRGAKGWNYYSRRHRESSWNAEFQAYFLWTKPTPWFWLVYAFFQICIIIQVSVCSHVTRLQAAHSHNSRCWQNISCPHVRDCTVHHMHKQVYGKTSPHLWHTCHKI